jgi:drug/metabolite transporter (DMT)-like permease
MVVSQAAGLIALLAVVAVRMTPPPAVIDLLPAVAAGALGALALTAFYRALAIGTMSVVAPVSATGALVPVTVGLLAGDRPGRIQLAGIAAAVIGVILASRELDESSGKAPESSRTSIGLALVAALGFGAFFVGMDAAAGADVLWALVASRTASVALLAVGVLALRPSLRLGGRGAAALVGVGALDVSANGLYAAASTAGLLSLVSVLGSLYPVVTVLLARAVLDERVRPVQAVGIVAAMAGVAMIAAG